MWVEKARKDNENLEGVWCVVELMGHVRLAGKVTEKVIAGYGMLQVDIPEADNRWHTEFINPSSLYRLTPASARICRQIAGGYRPAFQPIIPATAQIPKQSSWVDQDEDEPDDVDWQENYNRPDGKDHPIYWSVE